MPLSALRSRSPVGRGPGGLGGRHVGDEVAERQVDVVGVVAPVRPDHLGDERAVTLKVGELEMDTATRVVRIDGKEVSLTLKEFALLECFMREPDIVLTREKLFDHVWDFNSLSWSNVLDVHMKNLRHKLGTEGTQAHFETVRGVGYRLTA